MWIIGITGDIAGGKSTASRFLETLGAARIDADAIATEVTSRPNVVARLGEIFGPQVVAGDGTLNRSAVAKRVFGDDSESHVALQILESIVHPLVRREITDRIWQHHRNEIAAVILDVPLLIRSGWVRCCDDVVCVVCDRVTQLQRVAARGWTAAELDRRSARQSPAEIKRRLSTYTLDTSPRWPDNQETLADWYHRRHDRLFPHAHPCQ